MLPASFAHHPTYNRPTMAAQPDHILIDARLAAYRPAGIAAHVALLLDGLAELAPPEAITVLLHRRARFGAGWKSPFAQAEPQATAARTSFPVQTVWTPPHHRLEGRSLPLELWPLGAADLLHSPDVVVPAGWRGAAVATVHDVAFLRRPELLAPDSLRYYRRVHASVRRAQRVIAVSDYTRSELLALTDVAADKVVVVPNAVHPRFFAAGDAADDAAILARYGLAGPYILFVSTIEPRKNIAVLLRAYQQLAGAGTTAQLVLVGADGWHSQPVYDEVVALGLAERARFLGFVPDEDLAALYRRAGVLAHPALDEGFGLTPLEAMAAGLPVIVSDAGSLPEVVGEAGLQVPPLDAAAWAAALTAVLDDPGLAGRLATAGWARAAEYSPRRMAAATLDVYRAAWARHRGEERR